MELIIEFKLKYHCNKCATTTIHSYSQELLLLHGAILCPNCHEPISGKIEIHLGMK